MLRPPEEIQSVLREFEPDWFIAGGWAIDLFLGRVTRPHDDLEIAIFRQDQLALQKFLAVWNLRKAENGKLTEWKRGEQLKMPVHEIHCFNEKSELPSFEVLLNEKDGVNWQYRRNRLITKPLAEIYLTGDSGIRFLSPAIVLLYKSKNPRPKDEQDFQAVAGRLDSENRRWLKNALSICGAHNWLKKL